MSTIWMNHSGCVCSDESLVEESRTFESRLQSLLHDTIQESENSMEVHTKQHISHTVLMPSSCLVWFMIIS